MVEAVMGQLHKFSARKPRSVTLEELDAAQERAIERVKILIRILPRKPTNAELADIVYEAACRSQTGDPQDVLDEAIVMSGVASKIGDGSEE